MRITVPLPPVPSTAGHGQHLWGGTGKNPCPDLEALALQKRFALNFLSLPLELTLGSATSTYCQAWEGQHQGCRRSLPSQKGSSPLPAPLCSQQHPALPTEPASLCLPSPLIGSDVSQVFNVVNSVEQYTAVGGTAKSSVTTQIEQLRELLKRLKEQA